MERNLAKISQDEMDKVNVDLAAAGVAFKERYNMPMGDQSFMEPVAQMCRLFTLD